MLIAAHKIGKYYGSGPTRVVALESASFSIEQNEFVAIMGPSGSGKTTLMNLIGLLDRPSSGQLLLGGRDVTDLAPDQLSIIRNREIGFIFQSYNLLGRHTALENVGLPLLYAGVRKSERRRRSLAVLEEVGLSNRIAHWPTQLSGGEQQRVAVARALVTDPALIIADEPTGALDSHTGMEILVLLQRLHRSGRTIVLVTHDAAVAQHASRAIKLQDGRIIDDARLRASFRSRIEPADHRVRAAAVSA